MRTIIVALLALCAPAAVYSQEMLFSQSIYNAYTRPNRDRFERFHSARSEALQMSIATDDRSDQLTLENWGDNRADLKAGPASVEPDLAVTSGKEKSLGSKPSINGMKAGVYGRASALEYEGLYYGQQRKPNAGSSTDSSQYSAGFGYAHDMGGFDGGLHATLGGMRYKTGASESVFDRHTAGIAAAFGGENARFGLTADYMDFGSRNDNAHSDTPLGGPAFGAQAVLSPARGFKIGLRGSYAALTGDADNNNVKYTNDDPQTELGARAEWKLESLPLTLAAEVSRYSNEPKYVSGGTRQGENNDVTLLTGGAALRLLDNRLMLGAEVHSLGVDTTDTMGPDSEMNAKTVTGGVELWVLPGLALRGSYCAVTTDTGGPGTDGDSFAGGLGLRNGDFTADLGARFTRGNKDDSALSDDYSLVKLTASLKF